MPKSTTKMKLQHFRLFLILLWWSFSLPALAQQSMNLPLLSNWDDDNIPNAWTGAFSECWGYADNGREYAFLASTQGTYFFDITNPSEPQLIDFIRTKDTVTLVVNKDYATYSHYLYAVSDQGDNSLQIFDLQYLPDSVVLAYDSDALSKRCHTLTVENNRLYMCSNTRPDNSFGAMDVFSLSDPLNPVLMGTLSNPGFFNVHEVFVRNDTAYCSNAYNGLWIYDMKFPATPSLITIIEMYEEFGYNHSSWLTPDSKTLAFTDENHGKGVKLFDITDIHDPQFVGLVRSNLLQVADPLSDNGSMAHIPYIVGDVLLISYYHDGVVAFDISNPAQPKRIAWYDTHPQNTSYYSSAGCWGLYPFLPSGNIIASDISNGLFIFDGTRILNYEPEIPSSPSVTVGPNPVHELLQISVNAMANGNVHVQLFDMAGRLVLDESRELVAGKNSIPVTVNQLVEGIYVAKVETGFSNATVKILKTE
ncbi:MAG: choice-of-anchor B family protein [Bacteroidota bacterium]|nr:choice-of-anchor B family protein [Bacteroidota bacterium]